MYSVRLLTVSRLDISLHKREDGLVDVGFYFVCLNPSSYPCIGLDRPRGIQKIKAARIFVQSSNGCGKVVNPRSLTLFSVRG